MSHELNKMSKAEAISPENLSLETLESGAVSRLEQYSMMASQNFDIAESKIFIKYVHVLERQRYMYLN